MFRSLAAIRKAFAARPAALKRTKERNTKESAPLEFDRRLGHIFFPPSKLLMCRNQLLENFDLSSLKYL
jgi:hypothetical protein